MSSNIVLVNSRTLAKQANSLGEAKAMLAKFVSALKLLENFRRAGAFVYMSDFTALLETEILAGENIKLTLSDALNTPDLTLFWKFAKDYGVDAKLSEDSGTVSVSGPYSRELPPQTHYVIVGCVSFAGPSKTEPIDQSILATNVRSRVPNFAKPEDAERVFGRYKRSKKHRDKDRAGPRGVESKMSLSDKAAQEVLWLALGLENGGRRCGFNGASYFMFPTTHHHVNLAVSEYHGYELPEKNVHASLKPVLKQRADVFYNSKKK